MDNKCYWMWYAGDLEHYFALKQNFSRVERGFGWPAFWKSESFRNRVAFRRTYTLAESTVFTVYAVAGSVGFVQIDTEKHPFGVPVTCQPGTHRISVHIGCIECMPAIYVEGETVCSDEGWMVEDFDRGLVNTAYSAYFTDPGHDPSEWPYAEKEFLPVSEEAVNGGMLYIFDTELTAELEVSGEGLPTVYLGESRAEALDTERCYCFASPDRITRRLPRHALRYAYIPRCKEGDFTCRAIHKYVDIPMQAFFSSDDDELNRIFAVAAHTFSLCSEVFFLDGAKRDKWIWCGDAWQSMLVNRYLTADREIEKRTLIALRGNDPVTTHVNTIVDYSLIWILSVETYYDSYEDVEFLRFILPQMESLMAFCMSQRDSDGFLIGREKDWIFIDWADFDRCGPLCALQMILAEAYRVMARFSVNSGLYEHERTALLQKIEKCYWDAEKRAYIDSFCSGNRKISKHANIFAILFDIAPDERKRQIAENILLGDSVPAVTTPYFMFYELEALCQTGYTDEVMHRIKAYWGGMLKLGAVTFWEEYDPGKNPEEQYEMYGDPYGKSLCHAWGAGPIYLLARYFIGLRSLSPGGREYEVRPMRRYFRSLDCVFPMGSKQVHITLKNGELNIEENQISLPKHSSV